MITEFGLEPFPVTVRSLQITLIDKLHALNSNSLRGRIRSYSRHLYDIHMILPHIKFDGEFFRLLKEIGEYERKALASLRVPIKLDPSGPAASLRDVMTNNVYKEDYETVTMPLLFRKVSYGDAVRSLASAIEKIDYTEGEFIVDPPKYFTLYRRRTAKV